MIDTGASISIVKHTHLDTRNTFVDPKHMTNVTGLGTTYSIPTMGKTELKLEKNETKFKALFFMIDGSLLTSFPYDGIIGHDILSKMEAIINYQDRTLKLNIEKLQVTLAPRQKVQIDINILDHRLNGGFINTNTPLPPHLSLPKNILISRETSKIPITNTSRNPVKINIPLDVEFLELENPELLLPIYPKPDKNYLLKILGRNTLNPKKMKVLLQFVKTLTKYFTSQTTLYLIPHPLNLKSD